ncbi:transporter substrate-binding domain-containing protein [Uliginosibacterium sp. H3]|uniref:Transporter substrate-binding domain-containing protein n=1 Tax=Uliginosibacterium silvisoli TaxID=3114758 RepID=A0ABU6K6C7_9RHOO|nr:transporter substrate-binding domain-containing protein [Uliginosibacterium sp. H3]
MSRHLTRCLSILLLAITTTAHPAAAEQAALLMLFDVRPPFVSFDGKALQGSIGARAQAVLEKSGVAFELREVPVARQLLMVQQNLSPACAVARLKNVERLRLGVFSLPFAESSPYVAVQRKDQKLPEPASLSNWASHRGLRWGVQSGLYYSDYVQGVLGSAQAEIARFSAPHLHFAKLLAARRIDFVIVQEDEAQEMIKAQALRAQKLDDLVHGEQRFFYCSKSVPEASLRAINEALK